MYLKNIEVQGFKSFANKIKFDFHNGITGIVGPNGSGKSNVADAVRWVLGEQRVKQLRGGSMQDVIFSGTENRKPLSYASVAITLDNSDHKLPVDFEEVTVTRKLYRSGESEYLINGAACRLKDINEMFYDTGIGKEGYSIIGQGQIDKILSGKPEERRELWGEAFEENQDAIASAVSETQGMVLIKDGNLLEPAYFRLSAGRTRDGLEVLGEGYEYLVSVDCSHDVEDASYSNSVVVEKDAFWDALGSAAEGKVTLVRDSADYVLYVEYGETAISGEAFRSLFGLPSSCFTIKEENGRIVLNSFGVGHGLGFCQSEANRRAKEGEDYLSLLKNFFEGAQIQKI